MESSRTWFRTILFVILLTPLAGLLSGGSFWQLSHAQRSGRDAVGFFANLMKGQSIGLKEEAAGYVLTVMPGRELTHRISEVGDNYLAVVDTLQVRETRIPVYAIKSINTVNALK